MKYANLKFLNYSVEKKRDFLKVRLKGKRERERSYRLFQLILTSVRNKTFLLCIQLDIQES